MKYATVRALSISTIRTVLLSDEVSVQSLLRRLSCGRTVRTESRTGMGLWKRHVFDETATTFPWLYFLIVLHYPTKCQSVPRWNTLSLGNKTSVLYFSRTWNSFGTWFLSSTYKSSNVTLYWNFLALEVLPHQFLYTFRGAHIAPLIFASKPVALLHFCSIPFLSIPPHSLPPIQLERPSRW